MSRTKMWPHRRGTRNRNVISLDGIRDSLSWNAAEQGLTRLFDLGIGSVIFAAPLFMGGRHPVGRLVYVTLICLTAMVWAARQALRPQARWRWCGAEWLILSGLGLLVLQLAHLPQDWLTAISPNLPEMLPLWFGGSSCVDLGTWSQLSLYPQATRGALVMFLAYSVFFLLLVQRIETLEDIEWLFRWVALSAVGMATLGIVQMLMSNGKFLWVYDHPSRDTNDVVKGPFACQNHLGHLLAIGVVPLIWWAQRVLNGAASPESGPNQSGNRTSRRASNRPPKKSRTPGNPRSRDFGKTWSSFGVSKRDDDRILSLLLIGIAIVSLACLLTFSRGSVLVIFLAAGSCVLSYFALSLLGRKSILAVGGLASLLLMALLIFGFDELAGEMESVTSASVDEMDIGGVRRELWTADLKTFRKFSAVGTGVGSHPEVHPIHFERQMEVELAYAESGYVQLLMETGIAGATLFATAMALVLFWWVAAFRGSRDVRVRSVLFAIAAVMLASLVQSIWDFVWYIPACLVVTLVFLACLCRLRKVSNNSATHAVVQDTSSSPRWRVSNRLLWTAGTLLIMASSYLVIAVQVPAALGSPHWDAYETAIFAAKSRRDPSHVRRTASVILPELRSTATRDSNNARAHVNLAAVYLYHFDAAQQSALNPMSFDQIREVVLTAGFANLEEQDQWLQKAVGGNLAYLHLAYHHARRAAQLSPFQGKAYLHLNQLRFLYAPPEETSNGLVNQALLVRPHHGHVLVAAGVEAARAGDLERTVEYLRRAFGKGREHQQRVVELLAGNLPAKFFLEQLQPDMEGLGLLIDFYRNAAQPDDLREILPRYLALLEKVDVREDDMSQSANWLRGYRAYKLLHEGEGALQCVRRAVNAAPDNAGANLAFGRELIEARRFEEAMGHLRSCLYHRPDDLQLKQLLILARKKQLEGDLQYPEETAADTNKRRR